MDLVQSISVAVFKDNTLVTYAGGCDRYIDCNFSKVREENISLTAGGNDCINWAAGDVWEGDAVPEGVTATKTVKINTPKGYLWISPASFIALQNACNACCTEVAP